MRRLIVLFTVFTAYTLLGQVGFAIGADSGLPPDLSVIPRIDAVTDLGSVADNSSTYQTSRENSSDGQAYSSVGSGEKTPSLSIGTNYTDTVFKLESMSSGEIFPIRKGKFTGSPGEYRLTASKWGFYTQQIRFAVRPYETYTANFKMIPLPASMMIQQSKLNYQSYIALTTLAAGIGATAFLYSHADRSYDNYLAATEPPSASSWRKSYTQWRDLYNICLCFDVIPATAYIITALKELSARRKIKTEMLFGVPTGGK